MGEDKYTVRVTQYIGTGNALDLVLGADPHRVALLISLVNTSVVMTVAALGWPGGEATFQVGAGGPLEVRYAHSGPLCAGAWGGVNVMPDVQIDFVEILLLAR